MISFIAYITLIIDILLDSGFIGVYAIDNGALLWSYQKQWLTQLPSCAISCTYIIIITWWSSQIFLTLWNCNHRIKQIDQRIAYSSTNIWTMTTSGIHSYSYLIIFTFEFCICLLYFSVFWYCMLYLLRLLTLHFLIP